MGAKADPVVINAIAKLESGVGSIGRTDLGLVSTGNATTIIRFFTATPEAKIQAWELTMNTVAESLATTLLTARGGLVMTPESILKWVYFAWPDRKLAEWLPTSTAISTSFDAGETVASEVLTFDKATGQFTTAAKTKRKKLRAITQISELRKCIANLQYAFTYFYDESFVLPYFAAINSFIDEVDMETGSSISALNFMIDKFLNNEKSLLLRSLADGYPFHTWRPLGGYTRFESEIMPLVRTVHNKTTEKKVKAFSAQITGLEARLKAIRTATSVPPASKKAPKKAPKRPPTPSPLKPSPLKKVKPEPRAPKLTGLAAKRLEVAKSMGFNSVGRAVADWARKRREAGEPIACFWKSVGAEHGGPVECTNPTCPACVPASQTR